MNRATSYIKLLVAGTLVLLASVTCSDGALTGPRARDLLARLGFAPAFSKAASEIFSSLQTFGLEVNNIRVHLEHSNGQTAKDTIIAITPGQDSVVIEMAVRLDGSAELLNALIELRDDNVVLFSGTQIIAARAGGSNSSSNPPVITLEYAGPDAVATSLTVAPKDTAIIVGDSVAFRPLAKDKDGKSVSNLVLSWSVKDALRGAVSATGVFRASTDGGRGSTFVIARMLSGLKDSARINVVLPLARVAVVSGSDQTGTVGKALSQAIVVETQASDNLPVPFVPLSFRVVTGGGSVSLGTASTDANGRASVSLTLGSVAGANTIEVSATGKNLTPILVSALANADAAHHLRFVQQPPRSIGVAKLMPISVELLDQFNNRVTTGAGSTASVTLAISGGTAGAILGPDAAAVTKAAVGGVATFDVSVDLAGTGYALSVSTNLSLPALASEVFDVTSAPVFNIVSTAGDGVGLLKGEEVRLQARVVDAAGTGIPNSPITFTIMSGGGTLPDGATPSFSTTTNSDGTVAVDWHVGTSGVQLVRATTSTSAADFHAFIAETLVVVKQPTLTPVSSVPFPTQPRVQLQDLRGNQVRRSGVEILATRQLEPPLQDVVSTLLGTPSAVTDANGEASYADLAIAGNPQTVRLAFTQNVAPPTILPTTSAVMSLAVGPASRYASATGSPHLRFDPGATGASVAVRVTDGANGIPNVAVRFVELTENCVLSSPTATTDQFGTARVDLLTVPTSLGSCLIHARPDTQDPDVNIPLEQQAFLHAYFVPTGTPFWIGAVSDTWTDPQNWYGGLIPTVSSIAFIPIVWPTISAVPALVSDTTAVGSLHVEGGGQMNLNGRVLTVSQDLAADGIITGGGTVVATGRGALLRAGLIQGRLAIGANADYSVPEYLAADSIEVNSTLTVPTTGSVLVYGAMRTAGSGQLHQDGGITVQGDLTLGGSIASLTGGVLTVGGNLTFNGDCSVSVFSAGSQHITEFYNFSTTASSHVLSWNAPCAARFGALYAGLGANTTTTTLATNQQTPVVLQLSQLYVPANSRLNVPTLFTLAIDVGGGFIDIASGGVLHFDGLPPTGLNCGAGYLVTGDNPGQLHCSNP